MRGITIWVLALAIVVASPLVAQQKDADVDRLVQQYVSAWNKGDVKALVALFADNAMRSGEPDQIRVGKQEIEQFYTQNFAGPGKGTTLVVNQGRTQAIGNDVRVQEGTWRLKGAKEGPQGGRYVNTMVRQDGTWRVAALVTIPDVPPAK
jgi:uncharacterized protein (TIGR02246 family)